MLFLTCNPVGVGSAGAVTPFNKLTTRWLPALAHFNGSLSYLVKPTSSSSSKNSFSPSINLSCRTSSIGSVQASHARPTLMYSRGQRKDFGRYATRCFVTEQQLVSSKFISASCLPDTPLLGEMKSSESDFGVFRLDCCPSSNLHCVAYG